MPERVMVDMSATLIHHGHVRLLKKAAGHGEVVVALTGDAEVEAAKGYRPELSYDERREILEAIRYVAEVVPSNWLVDEAFLDRHGCRLLVHGDDNVNAVPRERLLILPRTEGVSSHEIRMRVLENAARMGRGERRAGT